MYKNFKPFVKENEYHLSDTCLWFWLITNQCLASYHVKYLQHKSSKLKIINLYAD